MLPLSTLGPHILREPLVPRARAAPSTPEPGRGLRGWWAPSLCRGLERSQHGDTALGGTKQVPISVWLGW